MELTIPEALASAAREFGGAEALAEPDGTRLSFQELRERVSEVARALITDGIAPGEWKLTETIVMNGNRMPPQTRSRCLSPEQAGDTAATFSPEYRTPLPL